MSIRIRPWKLDKGYEQEDPGFYVYDSDDFDTCPQCDCCTCPIDQ
jgi:hypothetical protein